MVKEKKEIFTFSSSIEIYELKSYTLLCCFPMLKEKKYKVKKRLQHTNTAGCSGLLVWCIGELKEKLKENIAWLCVNDLFVF